MYAQDKSVLQKLHSKIAGSLQKIRNLMCANHNCMQQHANLFGGYLARLLAQSRAPGSFFFLHLHFTDVEV